MNSISVIPLCLVTLSFMSLMALIHIYKCHKCHKCHMTIDRGLALIGQGKGWMTLPDRRPPGLLVDREKPINRWIASQVLGLLETLTLKTIRIRLAGRSRLCLGIIKCRND